jgi:hypothetical protein
MRTYVTLVASMLIIGCVSAAIADGGPKACKDVYSTTEVNACVGNRFSEVKKELEEYQKVARARLDSKDADTLIRFDQAVSSFKEYSDKMCRTTYSKWLSGTVRFSFFYCCQIRLAQQHATELWLDFIKYIDKTKPPLPRPEFDTCEHD